MASRAARAARIKAKKEKHKARKATTARLNPRRRGRPLYEREADAAASALLVQVGEELSERPEVARRDHHTSDAVRRFPRVRVS